MQTRWLSDVVQGSYLAALVLVYGILILHVLTVMVGCGSSKGPDNFLQGEATKSQLQPQPLPQEIVEAWEKAGAKTGWKRMRGPVLMDSPVAMQEPIPAFRLVWEEAILSKLPKPNSPFGLDGTVVRVSRAWRR